MIRVAGQTDQIADASPVTSVGMTFPQNVVAGNIIICFGRGANAVAGTYPDDMTASDTVGSTYVKDKTDVVVNEIRLSVFSAVVAASGANTVTLSSAGDGAGGRTIGGMEYTFVGGRTLDKTASAQGTSTAADSGNTATTTSASELLFGVIGDNFNGTPYTALGSWTKRAESGSGAGRCAFFDQIVSATGAYKCNATLTNSALWLAMIATYSEVGAVISTQSAISPMPFYNTIHIQE